ncbi:MAG: metallophosphoesterase family protein [Chloroflexi bacterium]|nr:metallophosphoesterase family protein [Chloroflexota bacterium]
MRVAVLSDIHSNLAALEAVLADAGAVDAVWCLGDVVGYGPDPNECIERLRELHAVCIVGNHDLAAVGRAPLVDFHAEAAAAARWTRRQLTPENREWLMTRPERVVLADQHATLVHGSPRDPIWEYVLNTQIAAGNLPYFDTLLCLIGHTHLPSSFQELAGGRIEVTLREAGSCVRLSEGRLIANPGSVGQPRDGNPAASYLLYEPEQGTLVWRRAPYPVESTQRKMLAAGLPPRLARRLAEGW